MDTKDLELANQLRKDYLRQYRLDNRDRLNEYQREYRQNHKDKVKQYNQTYWLKKSKSITSKVNK